MKKGAGGKNKLAHVFGILIAVILIIAVGIFAYMSFERNQGFAGFAATNPATSPTIIDASPEPSATYFPTGPLACPRSLGVVIKLAWDPNPETDIDYYTIYIGDVTKFYEKGRTQGGVRTKSTGVTLGLWSGMRHFFVATATNTGGLESDFSNEINYLAPSILRAGCRGITERGGTLYYEIEFVRDPSDGVYVEESTDPQMLVWSRVRANLLERETLPNGFERIVYSLPISGQGNKFYRLASSRSISGVVSSEP